MVRSYLYNNVSYSSFYEYPRGTILEHIPEYCNENGYSIKIYY